jgi:hypothetical protein
MHAPGDVGSPSVPSSFSALVHEPGAVVLVDAPFFFSLLLFFFLMAPSIGIKQGAALQVNCF